MGWRAAFIVVIAALAPAPAAYSAVFTVTGAGEGGTCSGTSCPSLRAAITAAEGTRAEADTINVPEGVIGISGDLVVQSEMTINGADARKTVIDGGAKYRLRTTASGILTLNRFTIRNGAAGGGDITDGGGIYNAGRLNLQDVRVTGSTAVRGGGIANNLGIVVADNLLVDNNVATGAGGGGGILNVAGQELPELRGWLIVTDTTIFKNTATGTGGIGGVFSTGTGASVSLNRSTIADNVGSATRGTGGIFPSGNTQATGSIVARNLAGSATVNCSDPLTSGLFSVEDDTDCGLAPGNLKPQLATALSNQGGQVDVLTIPTTSDAFNRMPFGDTPCESTDARGLSRPQGTACDAGAFEIDQPATVTITEGPTGTITSTSTQFNFQANEPDVTVECDLTGPGQTAGFEQCYKSNAQPYSNLADGPYTFSVRAVSAAFPNPTPTTRSFVVNAAGAPNTTITGGPTGTVASTSAAFTYTSSEPGSTFQCALDGAAFGNCPASYTGLAQGGHTFQVRAVDAAGVPDATPASRTWTVDTVAPDTTIGSGPTGAVASTTATFTFTSPESGVNFQCALDGGAFASCPVNYTGLAQGAHTFQVRAVDAVGNADATPASRTWTVDTIAPTVTIDTSPARTNDTTPSFTFSANEAGVGFQCRTDGGAFGACTSPYTTATLAEGSHTVEVRATDAAGNQGAAASRTIVVDTTAPAAPVIGTGPTSPTADSTPTFSFTGEAGAKFECRVDSAAFAACTSPHTTAALADGARTFQVRAVDAAGNASPAASRSITVDTTAPAPPTFTSPADNALLAVGTVDLRGTAEANATVQLTEGATSAGSSPVSATSTWNVIVTPTDGTHTYSARTIDAAGNQSTAVTRTIRIDTQPPDTTIATGPSGTTGDTTPTWTFTASEAGSTFECALDGAPHSACATPFTAPTLAPGTHTLSVRAVDPAGNRDNTPATRTILVDTSAPSVTITDGPRTRTNDTTPTFTFSAETGATLACRVDAAAFATCSSPHTTAVLAEGQHTFEVRATDTAGNTATDQRVFTVDTITPPAPTITWTTPPTDSTPTFTFASETGATFDCRLDGAGFAPCQTPLTTALLTEGPHRLDVRATDAAGNQSAAVGLDFTVDTLAPSPPVISTPTANQWLTASFVTVSGTAEAGASVELREGQFTRGTTTATGGTWSITVNPATDGTHTYEATARDTAGNTSAAATRTFRVDTVAPAAPVINTATATGATVTLSGTTEQDATILLFDGATQVGTVAASGTGWTRAFTNVADGTHSYTARARDAAGNTGAASAARSVLVDTGPPAAPTVTGPSGPTNQSTPTFTFAGETTDFACTLDGAPFDCVSPFTPQALADGPHVFTVKVFDAAGNASAVTSRSFTVDTAQPAPPDVSGPAGATTDPNPVFAFTAAESTVECRLDGPGGPGGFGACASPKTFNALAPGAYVFFVRTTDAAGNQSTTQRAFTVTQVQQATPTPTPTSTVGPAQTPQTVVVTPKPGGTVLVKAKGETTFAPLDVTKGIPLGSEVDVRKGRVTLTSIPRPGAAPQSADFYGGIFLVTQRGGITDLKLSEPLTGCPKSGKASAAAGKKSRKLWGNGKGSFRTSGKYSAATIRGTIWLVQDTCTTTLTRVTQGTVQVQDFVKKTKVLVKKGKPYTARAKRR
ncbi:Ig-like protein group 3 [Solirubrobacter pauli]|uniref:Ig-like protein group 3 n=1 Tax=Solirubrobacter pauli TaxID=166793 RepID=A0A660LB38_9ACTN|nr:Ig-like domain-containing protein [Solirubrobacter pauli]RKQ92267.1 Ig-like protein group 3 [Solirubrobacter pauli]